MSSFDKENDKVMEWFFENTFLRGMKEGIPNFDRLEIMLDTRCNLHCAYCYYNNEKQSKYIYPRRLTDYKDYVKNARILLSWLKEKGIVPKAIDIFGGEVTVKPEFFGIIDVVDEIYGDDAKNISIVVPTNYAFLLSEALTRKVEEYISNSKVRIYLSASIDGKYLESLNRPFMGKPKNDPRNDSWYDKLFEFNKRFGFGFHPMIYSQGIELWKKNFLWFQNMFDKHDIPYWNIYLLEIRNPEWTSEQIREFGDFIEFLIKWTFKQRLNNDKDAYVDFIFRKKGYNILNPFSGIGRGLGCSIQSMMYIRLSDFAVVPCHRTSYDEFVYGYLKVEDDKIVGFKAKDIEMMVQVYSFDASTQPYCEQCLLKDVCSHGCLGAQYEFTGDMFTPIPSVCALEHEKIRRIIKANKDIGTFDLLLSHLDDKKRKLWLDIAEGLGV